MSKKIVYLLFVLTAGLAACGKNADHDGAEAHADESHAPGMVELNQEQMQLMQIKIAPPDHRRLEGFLAAPARIEALPDKIADIGTLISGRVSKIFVIQGQRVKQGQPLLEIIGPEIGEIKGEYIRTRAALELARANYERQKKLLEENIAARRAFYEAQAAYEEAKAAFSAADQKLHSIGISDEEAQRITKSIALESGVKTHLERKILASLKITSPIDGMVGRFDVKLGQLVEPNTDVMEVVDIRRVWVVADIYEKDLSIVRLGQRVEVVTEAYPNAVFPGRLEYISPVVEKDTRTVKVRSTVDNPDFKLKPEMFATMRIFSEAIQPSIVVPESAVENDGKNEFVFVLAPENKGADSDGAGDGDAHYTFRQVLVKTGKRKDGFVEVLAGLKGDEKVVVEGAFFLKSELMKESLESEEH
ncbi:MAG: efflux RND transporter periplasmic adaptor subunit [candidate division KSB1 bacterium]|nr:efflux RND transporter periplasmic adaptor subunit [candidate division KSB1 bacterium]